MVRKKRKTMASIANLQGNTNTCSAKRQKTAESPVFDKAADKENVCFTRLGAILLPNRKFRELHHQIPNLYRAFIQYSVMQARRIAYSLSRKFAAPLGTFLLSQRHYPTTKR